MLASNCQVPLTSILLLFELTRDYLIILPTLAAVGIRWGGGSLVFGLDAAQHLQLLIWQGTCCVIVAITHHPRSRSQSCLPARRTLTSLPCCPLLSCLQLLDLLPGRPEREERCKRPPHVSHRGRRGSGQDHSRQPLGHRG